MYIKQCWRFIHNTRVAFGVDKNSLAALRKKTGYTFSNCKKALEISNNDIVKAEVWLKEQAQSLGWSKATKLEGRATAQGLIGVLIKENIGAMIEVNCETDFVAKNEHFKKFAEYTSSVCARYTQMTDFDGDLWKLGFESEALKNLKLDDMKTLGDHLALLIGTVGENALIKRAICFKTNNNIKLAGYTHPTNTSVIPNDITHFGKYGTVVAFRSASNDIREELQKNICQHIVGMNPHKVGEYGKDEPSENKDDEKCLIYQEYLLDPDTTVGDVLRDHQIEIIDFQRFECGELDKDQSLDIAKFVN